MEALVEMVAFVASMAALGWRPGLPFPGGSAVLAASGAAFSAVVIGQMANAFVCRSARRWPGTLGWFTNRLLVYAVTAELALLLLFLHSRPLATILGHSPPTLVGTACALLAFPAVVLIDALHKGILNRRNHRLGEVSSR